MLGFADPSTLSTPISERGRMAPAAGMPARNDNFNKLNPLAADSTGFEGTYDVT